MSTLAKDLSIGLTKDELYGKYFLELINPSSTKIGLSSLLELEESGYAEAGVALGQYYNMVSSDEATKHFLIAADADIAEGYWGLACLTEHSYIPNIDNDSDRIWLGLCISAAALECCDAVNELGNVCHRKKCYAESLYWYQLATYLGQPDGQYSAKMLTNEWMASGKPLKFIRGTDMFTEDMYKTGSLLLRLFSGEDVPYSYELMRLALNKEALAGYSLGDIYELQKNDEMAYKTYNVTAYTNKPHALRLYADMLFTGKGTKKDIATAWEYYEQAANKGERTAMFNMGEKARNEGKMLLAASWYTKALKRGFGPAQKRLLSIKETME